MRRLISQRSGIWNTTKWSTCSIPMVVLVVRKVMLMELQMDPKGCKNSPYLVHRHTPIWATALYIVCQLRLSPCQVGSRFRVKPPARGQKTGEWQPPCRFWPKVVQGGTYCTWVIPAPPPRAGWDQFPTSSRKRADPWIGPFYRSHSPFYHRFGNRAENLPTPSPLHYRALLLDEHLHFGYSQLFTGSLHKAMFGTARSR